MTRDVWHGMLLVAALLGWGVPGHAQTAADACGHARAVLSVARDALSGGVADGDLCRLSAVRIPIGGAGALEIATLAVRAEPLANQPQRLPRALRIEARGIMFALNSGNAGIDWLSRQQAEPFDVVLDVTQDPATNRATLHELSIRGEVLGAVVLSGVAEDSTPANMRRPRLDVATVSLMSLRLTLDSRGFIAAFLLPHLMTYLPPDDPGSTVAQAQAAIIAALRTLPARGATTETDIEALVLFVQDFPRPRRRLELSVDLPSAVPVTTLLATVVGGDLPPGMRIAATYPPRP